MTDEQQGEVVIVGDDGTDHIFPAGFDPKRAAAIVRQQTSGVPPATSADMLMRRRATSDSPDEPTMLGGGLGEMLSGMAHPQTAGDFSKLLLPNIGEAIQLGGTAMRSGMRAHPELTGIRGRLKAGVLGLAERWQGPQQLSTAERATAGTVGRATATAPSATVQPSTPDAWDRAAAPTARPVSAPATSAPPGPGMSSPERARLVRQGFSPDVIAKIEAIEASQPPMIQGRLRMGPPPAPAAPPIQVDQASVPEAWRPLAGEPPPPLQAPRVAVGAEQVGRGVGMSKEEVRAATNPILGEAPGEASPILPETALGKIIDTLKAMPPGSAEREAYVARATSGKAQWQIENIRRTLEHLGLIVPVAAAAPSLRDEVMKRLSGGAKP